MQKTLETDIEEKFKKELVMYHGTGGIHPTIVLKDEKQLDV